MDVAGGMVVLLGEAAATAAFATAMAFAAGSELLALATAPLVGVPLPPPHAVKR
jgi:hypothetical protein